MSIKILVMSDLHNEFEPHFRRSTEHIARQGKPKARPAAQALVDDWERRVGTTHPRVGPPLWDVGHVDLAMLPGDIDLGVAAVEYCAEVAAYLECPVVYTPGNHEPYKSSLQAMLADLRAYAAATNGRVHLLDRDRLDLEILGRKVSVLGATLWTDYAARGDVAEGMAIASAALSDHRIIRWMASDGRPTERDLFMPHHALELHRQARHWLAEEAPRARHEADVVLIQTHHAPVFEGNPPQFEDSELTPAFLSDMRAEIEAFGPDLWAFGHTHHQVDMKIGRTRLVSAQRGYLGDEEGADSFRPVVLAL